MKSKMKTQIIVLAVVLAIIVPGLFSEVENILPILIFDLLPLKFLIEGLIVAIVAILSVLAYSYLQDIFKQKKSTDPIQKHLIGEKHVFKIPEGLGDVDPVRKAVEYMENNFPFQSGNNIMPNFANGVLRDTTTGKIVKQYIACSRQFTEDYLKHYKVYLEAWNAIEDFETVICTKSDNYYFPPAVLTSDLNFNYVYDDEKKIAEFEQKGFTGIQPVKGDFMKYCHEVSRTACSEKRILNQIYLDFEPIQNLKNYELHIHTNMSPCSSCTALLKLQQGHFAKLNVTYDADMFNHDLEAVSKTDAEIIVEITEKINANYKDNGSLKNISLKEKNEEKEKKEKKEKGKK